jgi:hypothetical protein
MVPIKSTNPAVNGLMGTIPTIILITRINGRCLKSKIVGVPSNQKSSALRKKCPAGIGGAKEASTLSPDFDINAGTMFSFSELDTWLVTPIALLNDNFIAAAVTTDCDVGLPHAVFYAGRSDATFVANLYGACGQRKYYRTREGGC